MSNKVAFVASARPEAQQALRTMIAKYGQCDEADADVIVALGGDGCMLDTLRRRFSDPRPVYGMNQGTIGFLMNDYREDKLMERLDRAERAVIYPLRMKTRTVDGDVSDNLAINEVSLLRQSSQTACLRFRVTASWWQRLPAPPRITCQRMVRSFQSARICLRSRRSARSAHVAGAAHFCATMRRFRLMFTPRHCAL